ncbi:MAG: GNAT family N-acetyltransferase [Alphaproteobacteria bacterium]|nr:GNAT family N-acetyltransferase [Alphaproteobacteria bacterium]
MSLSPPAVRLAQRKEQRIAARVLTDAFVDEAGLNYWLKQGREKEQARRKFFDGAVRGMVSPKRALWLAHADRTPVGAAIWLPAGVAAFDFSPLQQFLMTPLMLSIAGVAGMRRAFEVGDALAARHPAEAHAHLVFLGVAPTAQGRGVGSAILKETLADVDAQSLPAYLETTTERNAALYQRHGFETTDIFDLPGVRFWTMLRPAR